MMRALRWCAAALLAAIAFGADAQVVAPGSVITSPVIVGGRASNLYLGIRVVTSNPANCSIGDIVFRSNSTAGQNLHFCTAANTWTQQLNSVSGILGSANGGTGNGFTKFAGPATAEKTFTLPDASATLTYTVASGAKALATGAISSAACTSAQTDTATGTATTDTIIATFNGDPTAEPGYVPLTTGMLTIIAYPTAGTVNFKVCNNTASSITPGAITLNWRVVR